MSSTIIIDEETHVAQGICFSRVKIGKCVVTNCPNEELLDCIKCMRHDICFNHMGGHGFTRIWCKDCIKIVAAEEYLKLKELGMEQKSEYD